MPTFEEEEARAMRLAGRLGLTSDDVSMLDLVARLVHLAASPKERERDSTFVRVAEARALVAWLDEHVPPA